jgi:hypothetical protein
MGIKDILAKAKSIQSKASQTIRTTQSRVQEHQAKANAERAQREAREAKELDSRLERLQAEEKKLRHKDATQSAIKNKRKQVADLEARVTTKGKILTSLNKGASALLKKASKKPRKEKRKRRRRH